MCVLGMRVVVWEGAQHVGFIQQAFGDNPQIITLHPHSLLSASGKLEVLAFQDVSLCTAIFKRCCGQR